MHEGPVEGTVRRVWKETARLTGVVLEVSAAVAEQYTRPGQVVAIRPEDDGRPVYIALASAPGEARAFELLLGEDAVARLAPEEGAVWRFDPPFGAGFPLESAAGRDVLLFAVGSALAPMRPLIEAIRRDRDAYGRVILFIGARSVTDFPYAEDLEAWADDGIEVRRSVSKPWVQDAFRADPVPVDNAMAFVCGMTSMMEGVTLALTDAGLTPDQIGKNW